MPQTFDIRGPDGSVLGTLNAPDGATPEQIRQKGLEAKARLSAPPAGPGAAAGAAVGESLQAAAPGGPAGGLVGQTLGGGPDPNDPGMGTAGAEMAGGTIGEMLGGGVGPVAAIGSGIGTTIGGTAADLVEGRPLTMGRTGMRMATGTLVPPAVGAVTRTIGKGLGAATRAISTRLPSFAEFAEKVAPGVLRRGSRALTATGGLADTPAETVIGRFRDWSKVVFDHVNDLAGDADVVPTASLQAAAEGLKSVPGLSNVERQAFQQAMERDVVPFATARHLESGFRRLARTRLGQKAMGDPISYQWSTLADAVGDDLEQFLATPQAAASGVGKALDAAKATYREGKQALSATEIYRRSITPGGHFDPRQFSRYVKRLDDKGILSRVMGSDRAPVLRELAEEFGAQTEKSHTVAGRLARKVGYAAPFAGAVGAEELYRHGQITPGRVAGAGATLAMLHPAGRALASTLAGQGLSAAARQQGDETSDFIRYLGQGFTP